MRRVEAVLGSGPLLLALACGSPPRDFRHGAGGSSGAAVSNGGGSRSAGKGGLSSGGRTSSDDAGNGGTSSDAASGGVPSDAGTATGVAGASGAAVTPVCAANSKRTCQGTAGNCAAGQQTCSADGSAWGPCSIQPQAMDACTTGDDANCNGQPNDGCRCTQGATQPCGPSSSVGICKSGTVTCGANGTWGDCTGVSAKTRDCNLSSDNDCDGLPDNTVDGVCKCKVGSTQPCNTHSQDGVGICKAGSQTCVAQNFGATSAWGTCSGDVAPKARDCGSSLDNDCDGLLDKGTGGPTAVKLPQGYCIDSTEVTRSQYQTWLNSSPSTRGQSQQCNDSNISFAPDGVCMGDDLSVCQTSCDNHPQVCIDWCDATAYCKAVGKRLCGKIGGGPNGYADHSNADLDQWYNACTSHGANLYAGGSRAATCNIVSAENNTRPVPTLTTCQSAVAGYTGVFDLTGNVFEWEDSCDGLLGAADNCHYRGGDYRVDDRNGGLQCGESPGSVTPGGNRRNATANTTGFRCCSL